MEIISEHYCKNPYSFPIDKYHQPGTSKGRQILIVGESPAPKGWVKSGIACYSENGKILATGKRLNELLSPLQLSVEMCGFTELSKCLTPNRKDLLGCSKKCWPIFLMQLDKIPRKLLILLGVHTTNIFNEISGNSLLVGTLSRIKLGSKNYSILPIYHPSPINPNGRQKNKKIFQENMPELKKILGI